MLLAFVRGIHRGPVNSPHKWPVSRKMFPFDDVIMSWSASIMTCLPGHSPMGHFHNTVQLRLGHGRAITVHIYQWDHSMVFKLQMSVEVKVGKTLTAHYIDVTNYTRLKLYMMTSSNGNIFHITGLLCGEFTGHRWIPLTKASDTELWCCLWSAPWINNWVNNRKAGDLRRHRAHYDVIVMYMLLQLMSVSYKRPLSWMIV